MLGADIGVAAAFELGAGIARREDAGNRRASRGVDAHAPLIEPAVAQPRGRRFGSDPDDEQVALDPAPVLELDGVHGPSAVEACDPRGEHELDPLPAVKVSEPLAELRSEDRLQGGRRRLDDRHGRAEPLCRCRDLLTDEAGSDHDQPWSCGERLAQCAGVVARAQFIYVFVALGARQATWRAARGDQQLLERDPASARQLDLAPRGVESGHALAEQQLDVMLGIPRLRPELERPLVDLAGEKLLGQRWAVVR